MLQKSVGTNGRFVFQTLRYVKDTFVNVYKRLCIFDDMEKACPNCGSEIVGRIDKRFCDDQCRSSYYNKVNRDSTNVVRKINNILRKNRRILEGLNPDGKAVVSKNDLTSEGFSFNYFTNTYTTKTGKQYHFVYEYGYVELENEKYGLVLKGDWVS